MSHEPHVSIGNMDIKSHIKIFLSCVLYLMSC